MSHKKIHFYKNPEAPNMLVLHKSEWNRLQKQANFPERPTQQQSEYLKALIEKSQGWIKTWPDTVQGCVALKEKQREKERTDGIATIKAFSKKKVLKHSAEAIPKAKQKIFDKSCYGTKLISALRGSKALEERDAQIKFLKEIKDNDTDLQQSEQNTGSLCTFGLDKTEVTTEDLQKCRKKQISNENKEMFKKQKEEEAKAKEQEKLIEIKDALLMKQLLDREKEAEDNIKHLEAQALEQYITEDKKTKEERAKWEAEYYAKIESCFKKQVELNCSIRKVHEQIIKKRQNSSVAASNFEIVKQCQDVLNKRYEDFIEKSIKIGEERAAKNERRAQEKLEKDRKMNRSIAEVNKSMAEYVKQRQWNGKCFCDRQSLIVKSEKTRIKKKEINETGSHSVAKDRPVPNFNPCNKLITMLKHREQAPPPWTGADAAHQQFAKNAEKTLRDCKYKMAARKVVDEYRKYNGLDEITLPIKNYN